MKYLAIFFASLLSTLSSAHAASINGHSVRFEAIFGDTIDSIAPNAQDGIYQVGTDVQTIFYGQIRIGISNNQVRLDWIGDSVFNETYAYNGLKFTDAFGHIPDFQLFHQANGVGVSNVTTEFDTETLIINFVNSGEVLTGSSALFEFRLSDTLPPVPLPATLPLLAFGFFGFAALRQRRNNVID